jgi:hypothetical protein
MKLEEIVTKIGKIQGWERVSELPGTFVERVPYSDKNTLRYLRPVTAKAVVATSTQNTPEGKSLALADKLLTFAAKRLSELFESPVSKFTPFDSGIRKFDSLLGLGPRVAQFYAADTPFGHKLAELTVLVYAVNHIEFAGSETEPEAAARKKKVRLGDLKREITPVVFARYQKLNGQRSRSHLAIGSYGEVENLVRELPEDGGVVEMENWERVRFTITADKGKKKKLEATFANETRPISLKGALELMEQLTHADANAAEKVWR